MLRLISRQDETTAASLLGEDHALVRLLARRHRIVGQLAAVSIPIAFGLIGTARQVETAPVVLGASGLVALVLVATLLFVGAQLRDRAQELIAAGYERLPVRVVREERCRLLARKQRERLARSLERLLHDAQNWGRARPLPGVRALRSTPAEVEAVVALLRAEVVRVPGVARTARFLGDGATSPLFEGDVDLVRAELRRIRDQLEAPSQPEAARDDRLAA